MDKYEIPTDEYVKIYDSLYKQKGKPPKESEIKREIERYLAKRSYPQTDKH